MKILNYIRVVLVEPTHPGNIGAVARAMGNMGLEDLAMVSPKDFPSEIANKRASGADWIFDKAKIYESLDSTIADCSLVIGTTARSRSIEWPSLKPWEAMNKAIQYAHESRVAILFGRESSGLTNAELDHCHYLVRIPVANNFASLNLGSAVSILLYELRKQLEQNKSEVGLHISNPSTSEEMKGFYDHLETVLNELEFIDGRSTKLMRKLMRLFNRAEPDKQELNMLRGILTAIQGKSKINNDS